MQLTVINSKISDLRVKYAKEFDSLIDGIAKQKIDEQRSVIKQELARRK